MPEQRDTDLTLPSYVASLSGHYATRPLVCTVVFHPRTGRIGERLVLPARLPGGPLVIGRNGPGFRRTGSEDANPIGDRHVSRRALVLSFRGEKLLLERPAEASRARVAGRELNGAIELDHEQLSRGVPIVLAHSVILLLRFDQSAANPGVPGGSDLGLRGGSNYLANLRSEILRAANSGDDVLIRGETGSGKEVVARAIHASGARAGKPLVAVNMAAIPTELAAPALFGNTRGAFTGAERASDGYFRSAGGCARCPCR
jgi:hypothetical protein